MNAKLPLLCLCLLVATATACADEALYTVTLRNTPVFEVVGDPQLSFYPLSKQMGTSIRKTTRRRILAADSANVTLRTTQPQDVLSQVTRQIAEQTGLKLSFTFNSATPPTDPVFFRQTFSDSAIITLLLVPAEGGLYHLICRYVIEERPADSNDGTPEAIAEMNESRRLWTADSTAAELPAKTSLKEIKPGEFFRGCLEFNQTDDKGSYIPIVVLMLKKGDAYTVGFYRNQDGQLMLLDQPVEFSGTKPPFLTNPPNQTVWAGVPPVFGMRANKLEGSGGYYVSLTGGHVTKTEF